MIAGLVCYQESSKEELDRILRDIRNIVYLGVLNECTKIEIKYKWEEGYLRLILGGKDIIRFRCDKDGLENSIHTFYRDLTKKLDGIGYLDSTEHYVLSIDTVSDYVVVSLVNCIILQTEKA